MITSFAVLGLNWWDVLSKSFTLMLYNSPLEKQLSTNNDSIPGSFPKNIKMSPKLRFLLLQAALCGFIVGLEMTLFYDSNTSSHGGFTQLFPYSLYPILEKVISFIIIG
jgi:hypothetical protein